MAVIAVFSPKGGVGKTTLAVDLAWRFAAVSGANTLLWDMDQQGGASFLLGLEPPPVARAAALFQRDGKPRQAIVHTAWPHLSIIQADESLRHLPLQLARFGKGRRLAAMTAMLGAEFERIVLDCPAGYNEVSEQVIAAAQVLIVPLPASPLSARALDMLRHDLLRVHHRHPPILPVLAQFDVRRRLHREAREGFAAGWPVIPVASPIEQAAVRRAPVGTFAASTPAGRALERLHRAIEAKISQNA